MNVYLEKKNIAFLVHVEQMLTKTLQKNLNENTIRVYHNKPFILYILYL